MSVMSSVGAAEASNSPDQANEKEEKKKSKERVSLYLPIPLLARLERVQEDTHASSVTEVLKSALLLYCVLVEEQKKGNEVYVLSPDGMKTKYPVFFS